MDRDRFALMRHSHIVSAVVRDVLERTPLESAGGKSITPRQLQLLEFIAIAAHHIDDVAKFLGITSPAATRAVDKLERHGLVVRQSCEGDRRVTILVCSEEGGRLVTRYRALQQQKLEDVLEGFDEQDERELTRLLERFAVALAANDGDEHGLCLRCSGYYDSDCPLQFTQRRCAYTSLRRVAR